MTVAEHSVDRDGSGPASQRRPYDEEADGEDGALGDGQDDGQRGAATVLVLALAAVVALVAAVCVALGSVAVARHRAAAAADLVALAVAARVLDGQATACARGAAVAQAQGAAVLTCVLSGDVVDVVVEVRPAGPLADLGSATGTARAGPGELGPPP